MPLIRNEESVFNNGELIKDNISKLITEHELGIERLTMLDNYYNGNHVILERSREGANNRVVTNMAEYITDFATSYFIGNPITYQFEDDKQEEILKAFQISNIDMVDNELCRDISKFGIGIELIYQNSNGNTISTNLDPRQAFVVLDDTVEYKTLLGIHYYDKKDEDNKVICKIVNVYTADTKYEYFMKDKEIQLVNETEILYGSVPMIEYWNKSNIKGDYESVIPLIDAYNKLQSDRINDKEQFVDALLVLYGTLAGDNTEEKLETARALKELGMLEMPSDSKAEFIAKTFNETDIEILKKSIVDDIHKISKVPNMTDENFAGNSSGVAMKYKLLGLEQLAKTKEGYYKMGVKERLKIYASVLNIKELNVDTSSIGITFNRSLPVNEIEISQLINNLKGTVSDETLLLQLPFIDDVNAEIDRIIEQKKNNIETQQALFGGYEVADAETVAQDESEE